MGRSRLQIENLPSRRTAGSILSYFRRTYRLVDVRQENIPRKPTCLYHLITLNIVKKFPKLKHLVTKFTMSFMTMGGCFCHASMAKVTYKAHKVKPHKHLGPMAPPQKRLPARP